MKRMRQGMRARDALLVGALAYTIVTLILAVLAMAGIQNEPPSVFRLELFVCVVVGELLMYFTTKLPLSSWMQVLVLLADAALPVFVLGGCVFHWFSWSWQGVLTTGGIVVASFFLTYGINLLDAKRFSDKINQRIKERRG